MGEATVLHMASGITRVVRGDSKDIGTLLRARTMGSDDGFRQLQDLDGNWMTINTGAVALAEAAGKAGTKRTIGFA